MPPRNTGPVAYSSSWQRSRTRPEFVVVGRMPTERANAARTKNRLRTAPITHAQMFPCQHRVLLLRRAQFVEEPALQLLHRRRHRHRRHHRPYACRAQPASSLDSFRTRGKNAWKRMENGHETTKYRRWREASRIMLAFLCLFCGPWRAAAVET